jgi:hypothetical protein
MATRRALVSAEPPQFGFLLGAEVDRVAWTAHDPTIIISGIFNSRDLRKSF